MVSSFEAWTLPKFGLLLITLVGDTEETSLPLISGINVAR